MADEDILNFVDPQGNIGSLPASYRAAAEAQGYRLATDDDIALHDRLEAASGRVGELAAFTGNTADAMTFGAFKPLLRKFAPETAEGLDIAQKANPNAAIFGDVTGFAGGLASPLVKTATKTGAQVFAKTGSRAAQLGAEGAVIAAPKTVAEVTTAAASAAQGDYEEAAEELLAAGKTFATGTGLGVALGAGYGGLERVLKASKPYIGAAGKWLGEKSDEAVLSQKGKAMGSIQVDRSRMTEQEFRATVEFGEQNGFLDILQSRSSKLKKAEAMEQLAAAKKIDALNKADQLGRPVLDTNQLMQDVKQLVDDAGDLGYLDRASRKAAKGIKSDIDQILKKNASPSLTEIDGLKMKIGAMGYDEYGRRLKGRAAEVFRDAYDIMKQRIVKGLEDAGKPAAAPAARWQSPGIAGQADEFLEASRAYNYADNLQRWAKRAINRGSNQGLSLSSLVSADIGGEVGGWKAALAGFLLNEARHEFGSAAWAKALQKAHAATSTVGSFLNSASKRALNSSYAGPVRVSALGTLRELSGLDDRHEATDRITTGLAQMVNSPELAAEKLGSAMDEMEGANPNLVIATQDKMMNAAKTLLELAPKKNALPGPFESTRGNYTESQVSDFERQVYVAMNPLSIMEDLEQGTLDPGSVMVVQRLYPKLFERMKAAVLDKATSGKPQVYSYGKKLNLSLLFGKSVDTLGNPQNIQALQKNFMPPKDQPTKSRKRMDYGENYETTGQRLEAK